ncbi:mechanosensitive ion channel domain-containing protein [Pseudomonas sp. CAU 1711]|uniref:mechanosensitive ion channel family protein n=1 Tax=Pseudomonas sp. CAU 1711 TaxID=3140356 RepID=UPI00326074F5
MSAMLEWLDPIRSFLPLLLTLLVTLLLLGTAHWLLLGRHPDLGNERRFPRQLVLLGLSLLALVILILVLPIEAGARNQILGLLGLLVSAAVAFSSSNILANLMAGVLLRMTRPFRIGDFIRVGEHFGRVSERGLFDTEIQTENRELIALPNTLLVSQPVITTQSSGTIVFTTLSLGFDVHHATIEPLLLQAATQSGLHEPFVHVLEIGDFSVQYRVSGFLDESRRLISARSDLCRAVLDVLHGARIEILSPTHMVQRPQPAGTQVIPPEPGRVRATDKVDAEELVFDKAEQAERMSIERKGLRAEIEALEAELKAAEDATRESLMLRLEALRERLQSLEQATPEDENGAR